MIEVAKKTIKDYPLAIERKEEGLFSVVEFRIKANYFSYETEKTGEETENYKFLLFLSETKHLPNDEELYSLLSQQTIREKIIKELSNIVFNYSFLKQTEEELKKIYSLVLHKVVYFANEWLDIIKETTKPKEKDFEEIVTNSKIKHIFIGEKFAKNEIFFSNAYETDEYFVEKKFFVKNCFVFGSLFAVEEVI